MDGAPLSLKILGALSSQVVVDAEATVAELRSIIAERLGLSSSSDAAALKFICSGVRLQVCFNLPSSSINRLTTYAAPSAG
jgi:hypothetical protein